MSHNSQNDSQRSVVKSLDDSRSKVIRWPGIARNCSQIVFRDLAEERPGNLVVFMPSPLQAVWA
jgi:hypothetical protein